MATIEMIQEFADSLGLPYFAVMNNLGELTDNALAIAGYEPEVEIRLSMEYINYLPGFSAQQQLFQRSADGQAMIVPENAEAIAAARKGEMLSAEGSLSFHIGDVLYAPGLLVKQDI